MTEPATDGIMHARMRNLLSLPRARQTGSGGSTAVKNRDSLRQHSKVSQGSRMLVTPAALPTFARVVDTKTNHERGDQAPTTDDMASTGKSKHPGILEGIPRRPRYGGVDGHG
jgi:hypothetical protein